MCGCGEVGVGVCMENPTPVQRLYHVIFVQSVIFGHSLGGLLNKLEGVGKCVCGRWVWAVGVGRWVWGGVW